MKILFLGNSITLHLPAPDIGWYGEWGMAASSAENDYVHRLCAKLRNTGINPTIRVRNIADFERKPDETSEDWFSEDISFVPDVVILRISENTPDEKLEAFAVACENLIHMFRTNTACCIIAVGPFWKRDHAEALIRQAAASAGAEFLSLEALHGKAQYQAHGQFEHAGVAAHPSDAGMEEIAEMIYQMLNNIC